MFAVNLQMEQFVYIQIFLFVWFPFKKHANLSTIEWSLLRYFPSHEMGQFVYICVLVFDVLS